MKISNIIQIGILVFALLSTLLIFVNTIITKKWRNNTEDESKSWKLGFIYYNPKDNRVLLPKRTGLGITFNFAKPISIIITVGIIIAIVVSIISGSN